VIGRREWWRLAGVLTLAAVLRFVWPLADPGARLSWSNGIYTDPATVTHAARNAALFGEWFRDESRDFMFYPLHNVLTWIVFEIFGVSRLATQLLAGVLGTLTVGAAAWAVHRCVGPRGGLLAATLTGFCFWLVMFSRVPVVENVTVLLLTIASALAVSRRAPARLGTGVLVGVAFLFGKLHAIAFLPALLLFLWLRDRKVSALGLTLAGVGAASVLWSVLVFLPHRAAILDQIRGSSESYGAIPFFESVGSGVREFLEAIRNSWLFHRLPVLSLLGFTFTLATFGGRKVRRARLENGTALFAFWFAAFAVYYSVIPYQAPRYYLLAVVPLLVCAAGQVHELGTGGRVKLRPPRGRAEQTWWTLGLFTAGYAAGATVAHGLAVWSERIVPFSSPTTTALREWLRSMAHTIDRLPTLAGVGVAVLVVTALASRVLFHPAGKRLRRRIERWDRARVAKVALGAALVLNGGQLLDWMFHRTYVVENAKESLDAILAEEAVVLGAFAPLLVQDTQRVALPQFGVVSPADVDRYGVTHLLVTEYGDPKMFRGVDAEVSARLETVHGWPFRTRLVRILRVFRIPTPDYRRTAFERAVDAIEGGRWAESLEQFREFRDSAPEIPDSYSVAARSHHKMGRADLAKESLERAIELRPNNPTDYHNLGLLLLADGDRRGALDLWLRGLALDPYDPELFRAAGQVAVALRAETR
jgi:4-amino-4-deoxy-L-arabinose transferase-like glycosyltransferase